MINRELEEQLKMVVCVCQEVCARADKALSNMGHTRERCVIKWEKLSAAKTLDRGARTQRPRLWSFCSFLSSLRGRLQTSVSTPSQTAPWPSAKDSCLPGGVAMEKKNTVYTSGQYLMQQALSVRDRVRTALPDQDPPNQICDSSDVFCFLFGILICPSLTWLTLRSLDLESASALDQSILDSLPFTATLITALGSHPSIGLATMASSIVISTGAIAMPVWKSCTKGRSSAFVSCWLMVAAESLVWSHIGGSVAAWFLVFMPFALGVGVATGLLWHKRIGHAH